MKKKKRDRGLLGENLEQVIAGRLGRRQWEFYLLTQAWKSLVGERAAAHILPAWIRKDTLWVYVDGSGWMQEMTFMRPQLLCRVNDFLPSVVLADIRWLQQPLATKSDPLRKAPLPDREIDQEKEENFLQMTRIIGDKKCGQALFQLWCNFQKKI